MGIDVRDIDQPVGTLSGGERQSVAIARAVYFGARVLILDEPTSALGCRQSGVVLKYIRAAAERGLGVIFITHNPSHAYPVGDRFLLLNRGKSLGDFAKNEIDRDRADPPDGGRRRAGGAAARAVQAADARRTAHRSDARPDLELLTVGRISVDLYAEQLGVPLREVQTFRKSIGGTATNVAVACARLGHRTAVFTRVGDDAFGDYVRRRARATRSASTRASSASTPTCGRRSRSPSWSTPTNRASSSTASRRRPT